MIQFKCDWCGHLLPVEGITEVRLKNVFNSPLKLHICRQCGYSKMPERAQSMLSWTNDS